ncbi:MAG: class I mannose-6-phosphate isomerase [Mycoplasmatales bacterium]|nr:class I mannose-6-phosphate isomerase [Mycoplasmatales bacterium]
MIKIIPLIINKIWGYELWLHSPYKNMLTKREDGLETKEGPLIKIIKADRPLSVQVHPDDKIAKELENEPNGKSECWYVLEKSPKSEFVVGINLFDKEKIRESLLKKDFQKHLIKINPNVGDFINVPAGLVHGVGAESKVLEIQQPSDTTYRFYDYDRLENGKPRELHIEKSLHSLKDLSWKKESLTKNFKSYSLNDYSIEIHKEKYFAPKNAIVIDLNSEIGYISEGEIIDFKHYSIISYNSN